MLITELMAKALKLSRRSAPRRSSPMASAATPSRSNTVSVAHRSSSTTVALLVSSFFAGFLLLGLLFYAAPINGLWSSVSASIYTIEVVNEFPHDPQAFTQGLLYAGNDTLYESTGLNGHSSVRRVHMPTGKVEDIHRMDHSQFGEGLTLLNERLFQVTWLTNIGYIYDQHNLSKFEKFTHEMKDGWGLATDGKTIFGSDGSSTLYQLDPKTLKVQEKVNVKYNGYEVHNINELEFVNGEVWANVWQSDCIARISHKDGLVTGWILLHSLRQGLISSGNKGIDVLNGIAWDEEKNRHYVTGKWWPKLYEIKLHPSGPMKKDIMEICQLR
ncbi:glutaminyl-peptide cyclotransferase [Amborella trichopoda]|uniref:glutaminyl-peptide cyclotransferase n=1 Tax=Amborella trichopoda TaxID=13333 RepID=UPI0005D37B2B|nr:glutaminyl-peptide cyclotransferase [Amborella trichopoda]|eukprot:XP_011628984.1 glutaminyl-peptide cyclotransferase [Amborella trichopoda]